MLLAVAGDDGLAAGERVLPHNHVPRRLHLDLEIGIALLEVGLGLLLQSEPVITGPDDDQHEKSEPEKRDQGLELVAHGGTSKLPSLADSIISPFGIKVKPSALFRICEL